MTRMRWFLVLSLCLTSCGDVAESAADVINTAPDVESPDVVVGGDVEVATDATSDTMPDIEPDIALDIAPDIALDITPAGGSGTSEGGSSTSPPLVSTTFAVSWVGTTFVPGPKQR